LIVTGTREGRNDAVRILTPYVKAADLVVHGGCAGVDAQVDALAGILGKHSARIDALWKLGLKAGPIRNGVLAVLGHFLQEGGAEVLCVALPGPKSKGTHDALKQIRACGIEAREL